MKTVRVEAKILVRKLFVALDSVRGDCGDNSRAVKQTVLGIQLRSKSNTIS